MNPYFLTAAVAATVRGRRSCVKCGKLLQRESRVEKCARCRSQTHRHKGQTEVRHSKHLLIVAVIAALLGLAIMVLSAT